MANLRISSTQQHGQLSAFRHLEAMHRAVKRWRLGAAAAPLHAQLLGATYRAMVHLGQAVYGTNSESKRSLRSVRRWLCRASIAIDELIDDGCLQAAQRAAAPKMLANVLSCVEALESRPVAEWSREPATEPDPDVGAPTERSSGKPVKPSPADFPVIDEEATETLDAAASSSYDAAS